MPSQQDSRCLEAVACPTAALTLLRLASAMLALGGGLDPPVKQWQAVAWRALVAGRSFAALDAARQPRSTPHALFSHLPSSQELLVRLEHLSGRALHAFAGAEDRWVPGSLREVPLLEEIERRLARLEQWLSMQGEVLSRAACFVTQSAGCMEADASCREDERTGDWKMEDVEVVKAEVFAPPQRQRQRGAWHLEQSVRLLAASAAEAGRLQREESALLHQMMLALSVSLSEAAVACLEEAAALDCNRGSIEERLQVLDKADEKLCRAEDLASASGHKAASALARASRGHLCGLAADMLVDLALLTGTGLADVQLTSQEASVLHRLCEEDDEDEHDDEEEKEDEKKSEDIFAFIGRLGDRAVSVTVAALHSIDPVVEPDAAATLSLMVSASLQVAATRLWALPPPTLTAAECRRAALDMFARAMQAIPGEGAAGSSSSGGHGVADGKAARLTAQAHLALCEVHAGIGTSCSLGSERPQHRQQRVLHHLDRAREALHRAAAEDARDSLATSLVLVRAHVLQAQLLGLGCIPSKRPNEQGLEEVIAGSRATVAALERCKTAGESAHASRMEVAWDESRALLLEHARSMLRILCTSKPASTGDLRWKDLYRASLKLQPSQLSGLVEAYDRL
eukprot:TRINITY_DN65515_c0_g1_i1.p1 TRINITY_DN65515_c0_g1~~TRINITY_DN65515_c0_g1_i1.p1  ORF type:complete len:709 (-),score=194.93 TRINITY_DN65515_c0_g1_i1:25-1908(-)